MRSRRRHLNRLCHLHQNDGDYFEMGEQSIHREHYMSVDSAVVPPLEAGVAEVTRVN